MLCLYSGLSGLSNGACVIHAQRHHGRQEVADADGCRGPETWINYPVLHGQVMERNASPGDPCGYSGEGPRDIN